VVLDYEQAIRKALGEGRPPRLYLDANVILDALRPERRQASLELVRESHAQRCECVSSYFAAIEALDKEQENAWARQKIRSKHKFEWIVRRRRLRDLKPQTLTRIANEFFGQLLGAPLSAVTWVTVDKDVWEDTISLAATTNVNAPDCIHIATAMAYECDVLVTDDQGLLGLAQEHIAATDSEHVLKTLQEAH